MSVKAISWKVQKGLKWNLVSRQIAVRGWAVHNNQNPTLYIYIVIFSDNFLSSVIKYKIGLIQHLSLAIHTYSLTCRVTLVFNLCYFHKVFFSCLFSVSQCCLINACCFCNKAHWVCFQKVENVFHNTKNLTSWESLFDR